VYMNMTALATNKYAPAIESLNPKERLEILILRRIFNSSLARYLARQTLYDNIQVVGGLVEQDQWKLMVAVKIRRDIDLKKADKFYMYSIFDLILNEGDLSKLSEISTFYEKLPLQ
nr:hypothetical protein [Bdellovibrionales bacterium]